MTSQMTFNESSQYVDEMLQSSDLNQSSYESKLCRAFEELRLKRKTERENEKIIYSLLQTKYDLEKQIEEEKRNFEKEKKGLQGQLETIKKELSQKDHTAQCTMVNQQTFSKMFEKEILSLRDELKAMHIEYIDLEKKCSEFEMASKLHKNLKDAALKRVNEVQQNQKELKNQLEFFKKAKDELKDTVDQTNLFLEERDFANKHLLEMITIMGKRIKFLGAELIKSESKLKYIVSTTSYNCSKTSAFNNKIIESPKVVALSKEVNSQHQKISEVLSDIHKLHQELSVSEKFEVKKDSIPEEELLSNSNDNTEASIPRNEEEIKHIDDNLT